MFQRRCGHMLALVCGTMTPIQKDAGRITMGRQ
jgi:hypothetical protein